MANAAYSKWLEEQASAAPVAWLTDTIRIALVDSSYTFADTPQHFSDLSGVLGVATLANKSCTAGVLAADDPTVTGPLSGTQDPAAAVIYKWTGTPSTSRLMLFFNEGVGFDIVYTGDVRVVLPKSAGIMIFPLGGH